MPLRIQRGSMDVELLEVFIDTDCLLGLEGDGVTYESATLDAMCLTSGYGHVDPAVPSMSVVVFGLARNSEPRRRQGTNQQTYGYDSLSNEPFRGYSATGRLFSYVDDIGRNFMHGTLWLDAKAKDALLPGMSCDASWNSRSFSSATCRYFGDVEGVRLFVTFKSHTSSLTTVEQTLNAVVAKLRSRGQEAR